MRDGIEGDDFLFDHYAVLGLSQDADAGAIRSAYRQLMGMDHPDMVDRSGKQIRDLATTLTKRRQRAYEVLSNPESKDAYDAQLRSWTGPLISDSDGLILMDGASPTDFLKLAGPEGRAGLERLLDIAHTTAGYDESTLELLAEQYDSTDNPSDKLRRAYDRALSARAIDLYGEALVRGGYIGLDQNLVLAPLETVRTAIENSKSRAVAAIGQGTSVRLALPAGSNTDEHEEALVEDAIAIFDGEARRVLELVSAREEVMAQRLTIPRGQYLGQAKDGRLSDRIIVGAATERRSFWYGFAVEGSKVTQLEDVFEIKGDADVSRYARSGFDVIRFEPDPELPVYEQLETLVQHHYDRFIDQPEIDTARTIGHSL